MTQFLTKIASAVTALALIATFLPAAAFAEGLEGETVVETTSELVTTTETENSDEGAEDLSTLASFEPTAVSATYTVTDEDMTELQTTIDNANAGDVVVVSGTYTGNLTVSKGVNLKSQSGPTSASIDGSVIVTADGATVDGFTIHNESGNYGIQTKGASNVVLKNNIISNVGTSGTLAGTCVQAQGIYVYHNGSNISNITVENNTISNVGTLTTYGSQKGIYVGDTSTPGATISNITISGNTISSVYANTSPWISGGMGGNCTNRGAGAYGITTNHAVSGLTVSGNTISTLEGLWVHGIGLEANTPSAVLSSNTVSGFTDHKGGVDQHAVFFENNAGMTTTSVDGVVLGNTSAVVVDDSWAGYSANPMVTVGGQNYLYDVNAFSTIRYGINAVSANGTVSVLPGNYDLVMDGTTVVEGQTGWYLAITKSDITLRGVDASGAVITDPSAAVANVYSTQETANGNWSTQNLVTVFGDDVTIQGLVIMNKLSPNKGIEVLGDNFTAQYNRFAPIPTSILPSAANYSDPDGSTGNDISKYGSGVYFNNNGATTDRTGTVSNNLFQNSGVTFDSFGDNWTMSVTGNTFDGNKSWTDGSGTYYYSAIGANTWATPPALDFSGSEIAINQNKFVNMVAGQKIVKTSRTDMVGMFDASRNWWGTAVEAEIQALVSTTSATYAPWYVDEAMTRLNTDPEPSSGSGGGSGRSGSSSRSSSDNDNSDDAGTVDGGTTGEGQVLGAETYNFTVDLTIGSTGADVTALQAILIASGDLAIAAPTGYFGEMTRAALAKWQAKHNVSPAVGYFGPLTRAAIAAAGTPTMSAEARAAMIKDLLEKVKELQEKLDGMN